MISIGIFGTFLEGWALSLLWNWYVTKVFDVHPITIPMAIGLTLVFAMLTYKHKPSKKNVDPDEDFNRITTIIVVPLMVVAFGWFFHLFI